MKRMALATIVFAAGTILATAAHAEADHKHDAPKSEAGASQKHDEHCCKPAPGDIKWIHETADHQHDHARAPKKPAAKKSARKPARDTTQTAK